MSDTGAVLKLNRTIYPTRAVNESLVAFGELLDAEVEHDGDYHRVVIRPKGDDYPIELLLKELANFALSRAARSR